MNISEIEMQLSDLVSEPLDKSEFVFKFMEIFNAPKATISKLRKGTQNKADKPEDMLWQRKLYFHIAEVGETEVALDALRKSKPTKTHKPRFILSTDGKDVSALDTKVDKTIHCDFEKLNDHFDFFLPLAGIDKYKAVEENPADIKAAGRLAKFYDEIVRHNPDWHTPEKRHALNQFMARILFCLFSEDTGSFEKDLFVKTITEFGGDDGGQIQTLLNQVFDVMNVSNDNRGNIPAHIRAFPYVNGGLFAEQTEAPAFNKRAKQVLIEAARLDWREISPDIFGSMIQAVVDDEMRGDLGMHYTSVPNIMKVLQPLFLMPLEEEFASAREHRNERSMLSKLLNRISKIRVFDPACGSGNFLIIAYRELRSLEMRIFQREDELEHGQSTHRWRSNVQLKNFYGIEVADFPAETAKLSLWIIEYQMNQKFKRLFGEAPPDFPLREGGNIVHGNALRVNWLEICRPADDEGETYIIGNPPYSGRADQTKEQKEDMSLVFSPTTRSYKNLDYVACWYLKGMQYLKEASGACAFVATNSICQGEQVALLWPIMFQYEQEIYFAHQSFKWRNNAKKNAAVTCVIVGVGLIGKNKKILFSEGRSKRVKNISPYLFEGNDIIVTKQSKPLSFTHQMVFGSMANDGGFLILSPHQKKELLDSSPEASRYIRPIYGSQEFTKGVERYCIWINENEVNDASQIPGICTRIDAVSKKRAESDRKETRELAEYGYRFGEVRHQDLEALIVPKNTSALRDYITVGIMNCHSIITDLAFAVYGAPMSTFSIISSRLHYLWGATVGGCFKLDPRYSNTLVYNTFPVPILTEEETITLESCAWNVIQARENNPGKTIAWLYDMGTKTKLPTMPEDLLVAHQALDDTLEKIYIGRPFKDDIERLEHLFKLYEEMTANKNKEASSA
jgi:hypothetical protein